MVMKSSIRMSAVLVCILLALPGCGWLADPERIVVARIGDEAIRREDLTRVLREMLDDERPLIKSRNDLRRVLEHYIDYQIKQDLAEPLAAEGKISIPRQLAANRFDMQHPDYRRYIEFGKNMGLSDAERKYFEQEREYRIDLVEEELLGEAAISHRIREDLDAGTLEVSDEEYEEEYGFRKDELKNRETLVFEGIFFPTEQTGASTLATSAFNRMKAGENVRDLAAEYAAAGTGYPISSQLENDPRQAAKFGNFWQQASGSKEGDVIGPLFIKGWESAQQGPDGQMQSVRIPDSFLVARVIKAEPETQMTLEEAKPVLAPGILYAKMIRKLHEEYHVEILEENLPDPSRFDPNAPQSVFDTKPGAQGNEE